MSDNVSIDVQLELHIEAGEQKDFLRKKDNPYNRLEYLDRQLNQVCKVKIGTLSIGDIIIYWADYSKPQSEWKVLAIIERKNWADMASSVTVDDRYYSQSQRMNDTGCPLLYWLVIGEPPARATEKDKRAVKSAIIHLSSFKKFKVLKLEDNEMETVYFLGKTLDYIKKELQNPTASGLGADLPTWRAVQEAGRRPQLDNQAACWIETLNMPTRVGRPTARAIAARFSSFSELYLACRRCTLARSSAAIVPKLQKRKAPLKGSGAHPDTLTDNERLAGETRALLEDYVTSACVLPTGKLIRHADAAMVLRALFTDEDFCKMSKNSTGPVDEQ